MPTVRVSYTPPVAMPVRVTYEGGGGDQAVRVAPAIEARVIVRGEFNIGRQGSTTSLTWNRTDW